MTPLSRCQMTSKVKQKLLIQALASTYRQNLSCTNVSLYQTWQNVVEAVLLAAYRPTIVLWPQRNPPRQYAAHYTGIVK
jgi:hypothetical protein